MTPAQASAATTQVDGAVYFIAAGEDAVKIGWALIPERRLTALQIGNNVALRFLGSVPGSRADERAMHRRLSAFHVRGEWYDLKKIRAAGIELPPSLESA